jgi:hypothetical protein
MNEKAYIQIIDYLGYVKKVYKIEKGDDKDE